MHDVTQRIAMQSAPVPHKQVTHQRVTDQALHMCDVVMDDGAWRRDFEFSTQRPRAETRDRVSPK
jgi:hypothetical protein